MIAHVYEQYKHAVESGEHAQSTLENLGIERYCCRRMFVGHVDLLDEIAPFSIARDQL